MTMTSGGKSVKKKKSELKRRENKPWSQTWRPIVCLHVNECHLSLTRRAPLSCLFFRGDTEQQQAAGYCGSFGWAVFSPGDNTTERTQECATKMISNLPWHESSYPRNVSADLWVASHYVTLECFFVFKREYWCCGVSTLQKKGG